LKLAKTIERIRSGSSRALGEKLEALGDYDSFCEACEEYGIFSNLHTLEVDLFQSDFRPAVIATLREAGLSAERKEWLQSWEADPETVDAEKLLALIEDVGKGRFAQRLATKVRDLDPPDYIERAIRYVADRV
jgi:putative ATP-dependent endonuclease of OLD family